MYDADYKDDAIYLYSLPDGRVLCDSRCFDVWILLKLALSVYLAKQKMIAYEKTKIVLAYSITQTSIFERVELGTLVKPLIEHPVWFMTIVNNATHESVSTHSVYRYTAIIDGWVTKLFFLAIGDRILVACLLVKRCIICRDMVR